MTLPQYCLSYIESRWVWMGFQPPLPARNDRWSFSRVLVFTAGQTLAGAAIGGALAALFSGLFKGIPVWLIWLTAGFSACQGIVGYGLTAVCWNQRAARLQANPGLDVSIPPARYPFFRVLLNLAYFALLAIITPAAMVLTVENMRGEFLWRRERARVVAQGERLAFRELLGPTIPPDQNAGAAAIFAPLFDYRMEHVRTPDPENPGRFWESYVPAWRDSNALNRLEERLGFPDSHWPESDKMSSTVRTPKLDLSGWADAYRSLLSDPKKGDPAWVAEMKLPSSTDDPARVVLAGLAVADRELAAICEASSRPRAQFPVHYGESLNNAFTHFSFLKGISQRLALRCAAHLEAGETDAASLDAQCALRVAELLREEPLLISQLVRMAQGSIATRTIWQGLAEHLWSDAQLAAFQEQLAKVDYLSGIVLAFEGERAWGIELFNNLIAAPEPSSSHAIPTGSGEFAQFPPRFLSLGAFRQNQLSLLRHHSGLIAFIRSACSNAPQCGLIAATKAVSQTEPLGGWSPYNASVWTLQPFTDRAMAKAVRSQTLNRMAIVACALERYHLKHGVFPVSLNDLAPAFLPVPPLDPMTNLPFHYQRTDDGWFRFYSVGADGKDDGGIVRTSNKDPEKDWPWPVPTRPEKFRMF